MAGPVTYCDLQINQGEDWSQSFWWGLEDPSGDPSKTTYPYSFATATIKLQIRAALDSSSTSYFTLQLASGLALVTNPITGALTSPSLANGFSATLTSLQTLTLPNGATLYYDAFATSGGLVSLWLQGKIYVGTTVTR
jgi:hypothetical protein